MTGIHNAPEQRPKIEDLEQEIIDMYTDLLIVEALSDREAWKSLLEDIDSGKVDGLNREEILGHLKEE